MTSAVGSAREQATFRGKYVSDFGKYGLDDIEFVGGKVANLGHLASLGAPGSPGVALEVGAYWRFLDYNSDVKALVERELSSLDTSNEADAQARATRIREAIKGAHIPSEIVHEVREGYNHVLGHNCVVAVRSSATAEDLPGAAFAGQQDTLLGIRGIEDILAAILQCYSSLFNYRAILYREKQGINHFEVGISVAIQKLVNSTRSGVIFTVDTVTSDRSVITIEAIYGLGELFVSGETNADLYTVAKGSLDILQRRPQQQEVMVVLNAAMNGTEQVPVEPYKHDAPKLSDDLIITAAQWAQTIEAAYGRSIDIEFGVDEEGNFIVLQTRPETANKVDYVEEPEAEETASLLSDGDGLAASGGVVTGRVVVINSHEECYLVEEGDIMVTENTTPDFMPGIKRAAGIISEKGGKNGHTGVTCRELRKPAIASLPNARTRFRTGQIITLDGSHAKVYDGVALNALAWAERRTAQKAKLEDEMRNAKTHTKIGAIAGDPELAEQIAAGNADYIPLLRAEQMIAHLGEHPLSFVDRGAEEEYISFFEKSILRYAKAFAPKKGDIWFRFNDQKANEAANLKGADKYIDVNCENPMLYIRGGDLFQRHPDMLRLECEAIRRVIFEHGYNNLVPMFPFVRTVPQLAWLLDKCAEFGLPRDTVRFAMMVELPTNVILLEKYIRQGLWGVSIGTNDLTQLTLGADRDGGNAMAIYDERDEAVQVFVLQTVVKGRAAGAVVSLCGNMVANYIETLPPLLAAGIHGVGVDNSLIDRTRIDVSLWEAANHELVEQNFPAH